MGALGVTPSLLSYVSAETTNSRVDNPGAAASPYRASRCGSWVGDGRAQSNLYKCLPGVRRLYRCADFCPVWHSEESNQTAQLHGHLEYWRAVHVMGNTNWSSNKPSVATVGTTTNTNRGLVTAVNPESVSMAALFGNEPYGAGYICLGNGGCPMASFGDTTGGTVDDFNLALRSRSGRAAPGPKIARCTQQRMRRARTRRMEKPRK